MKIKNPLQSIADEFVFAGRELWEMCLTDDGIG